MKVKCIANTGKAFVGYKNKPVFTSEHTTYGGLDISDSYNVMALCEYENNLYYLVDSPIIGFYPYQLFVIVDNHVPDKWFFNFDRRIGSVFIKHILGYYEICFSDKHYNDLLEQDENAIQLFLNKRREIFGF